MLRCSALEYFLQLLVLTILRPPFCDQMPLQVLAEQHSAAPDDAAAAVLRSDNVSGGGRESERETRKGDLQAGELASEWRWQMLCTHALILSANHCASLQDAQCP
jgi:hypothetical protein